MGSSPRRFCCMCHTQAASAYAVHAAFDSDAVVRLVALVAIKVSLPVWGALLSNLLGTQTIQTENPHHLSSPCRALRDSTDRMDVMEAASDTQSQSQSQEYWVSTQFELSSSPVAGFQIVPIAVTTRLSTLGWNHTTYAEGP